MTEHKTLIVNHLGRSLIFERRPPGCPHPFFTGNGTPIIPNAAKFAELIPLPAVSAHRISSNPNRGFPRCLDCNVTPYGIGRLIDKGIQGGVTSYSRMTPKAPVRTEPHPTFRNRSRSLLVAGQKRARGIHVLRR